MWEESDSHSIRWHQVLPYPTSHIPHPTSHVHDPEEANPWSS
jgi:hypothetical protein